MTAVGLRRLGLFLLPLIAWDVAWLLTPSSVSGVVVLLGLPVVLFLPGLLIIGGLGARRLTALNGVFAVGFSLVLLYAVGLGANFLPRWAGAERPLDTPAIWILFNLGYLLAAVWAVVGHGRGSSQDHLDDLPARGPGWVAPVLAAVAVCAPILAVLGAVTLNNGGGNGLALRALVLVAVVTPAGFLLRHRVGDLTLITVLAAVTAALLLATSMRSWYVGGQDLQHEFQVFRLAQEQGRWDLGYRDPYNACLSVTLLPVSLAELLRLDGALVFKVVSQLLFCTVPLTLFASTRRFLGRGGGYLVAFLFIGLPTFSIDVPFITRQQVAFVFVALAITAVFATGEAWLRRHRVTVFVCMSAGLIVSHYSTAYLFIAGLLATFTLYQLYRLAARLRGTRPRAVDREEIPGLAVLGTILVAVVWLGPVTHASGDLFEKVGQAAPSILEVAGDPGLVLGSLGQPNAGDDLEEYVATTVVDPKADVRALTQQLELTGDEDRPASTASRWVSDHTGIDPSALLAFFYYGVGTKLYLLCCGAGTLLLFSRRIRDRFRQLPVLYPLWALSVSFVIGLQVLIPELAADYGITRAFMQAFIVLCVPMVVVVRLALSQLTRLSRLTGPTRLTGRTGRRWLDGLALAVPALLFVVYSGLGPQLTGGLHRQLSLENAGAYYGTVYPTDADVAAVSWVSTGIPEGAKVNYADFAAVYAYHPTYRYDFTAPGLFPFQVGPGNYVMLSGSQTSDHVVYTFDSRKGLRITPQLYADSDLLYSSGIVQVFRKN